jgi:D-methionine transport system substrate-binding protein
MKGKHRRKLIIICTVAVAALAVVLSACGGSSSSSNSSSSESTSTSSSSSSDDKVITVGASSSPHAEILEQIKPTLEAEGYTLNIVEYSDYVQPNEALAQGELDANYFQHKPYLDNYNAENGTDLVSVAAIHFEPMSIYSNKYDSLSDIPDGATIAVPSDSTNEARALLLLQANGIITLNEDAGLDATANDIADNPHNIQLVETEAANVARTLDDVDFAVVNGNYALSAGLDTTKALASESSDSEAAQTYANIIACRDGDQDSDKIVALVNALETQEVKDYINDTYKGTVVAVF